VAGSIPLVPLNSTQHLQPNSEAGEHRGVWLIRLASHAADIQTSARRICHTLRLVLDEPQLQQ
jgi:hypothetical protein